MLSSMRPIFSLGPLFLVLVACAEGTVLIEDDDGDGGSDAGGGSQSTAASMTKSTGSAGDPCGDGSIDAGEECDGSNLSGKTCEALAFASGTLGCNATCTLDTSGCIQTLCDNGMLDDGEDCDGTDLGASTCVTAGFAGGDLACAPETCLFDTAGCREVVNEGFEGGAFPTGFTTNGWSVASGVANAGTYAMRSGIIGDYGTTSAFLTLQVDVAGGSISFFHSESTELDYDFLEFYVDGVMQSSWSGITSWSQATFALGVGTHSLEWRYAKDGSLYDGSDTVYVDQVTSVNGYIP